MLRQATTQTSTPFSERIARPRMSTRRALLVIACCAALLCRTAAAADTAGSALKRGLAGSATALLLNCAPRAGPVVREWLGPLVRAWFADVAACVAALLTIGLVVSLWATPIPVDDFTAVAHCPVRRATLRGSGVAASCPTQALRS
jgi:hypothetical protein